MTRQLSNDWANARRNGWTRRRDDRSPFDPASLPPSSIQELQGSNSSLRTPKLPASPQQLLSSPQARRFPLPSRSPFAGLRPSDMHFQSFLALALLASPFAQATRRGPVDESVVSSSLFERCESHTVAERSRRVEADLLGRVLLSKMSLPTSRRANMNHQSFRPSLLSSVLARLSLPSSSRRRSSLAPRLPSSARQAPISPTPSGSLTLPTPTSSSPPQPRRRPRGASLRRTRRTASTTAAPTSTRSSHATRRSVVDCTSSTTPPKLSSAQPSSVPPHQSLPPRLGLPSLCRMERRTGAG